MAYPERKPIYENFEKIAKEIVENKMYREYAEAELASLIAEITSSFNSISNKLIWEKFGSTLKP